MEPSQDYVKFEEIPQAVQGLREVYRSGLTRSLAFRKKQLRSLYDMLEENLTLFDEALMKDLGKPQGESRFCELHYSTNDIIEIHDNFESWAKPDSAALPLFAKLDSRGEIRKEPLGVVLIIGAWNYPITLTLGPLAGAIGAGNTVVLKPSEVSGHTAKLLAELIPKYLDPRAYRVLNGAVEETTAILKQKFDHIFYTGNGLVGRHIMAAAAKHLTPVTLELGGKSPVVICQGVDMWATCRRIAWGKFVNSGQTCIAPDYILIEKSMESKFIEEMANTIKTFFGENVEESPDFGRIVNERHFDRLDGLLKNGHSGKVALGGHSNREKKYIAPTLIQGVQLEDKIMQEEIFGPILPILTVDNIQEAIDIINSKDHPLTMYIFTPDKKQAQTILDNTQSGGACVNDTLMQMAISTLPFGGVGGSGMGSYHGKKSFDTFSHHRSTLIRKLQFDQVNDIRYPPYNETKYKLGLSFIFSSPSWKRKFKLSSIFYTVVAALGIAAFFRKDGISSIRQKLGQ
ncbi:aldehyde dehydrogenase 3A2 [Basidiobolus meristosporus CBS 931.73]|uniref:Aldehyde dehydrogenase n=1 Tax=Basidiobolus meristosporus CBS 931.73 TaxID=1314790 RepID=A0A1Y1X7G9_9FUNG|nr:aldehyde dehydrogenase 3A2 [Basidiobolus meristosporus CBS 931.73]|eukprot:ORX81709.1 aldehyde dehydrogenase 3A2 [Basidiobolus meristosporus CBS 931.73]